MIVTIVGPTASGKTGLALELGEVLANDPELGKRYPGGVEIVNADAFGLYRGMDIGTAKTPLSERRGIPHHQLDVLWPDEEASVAAYQRHAREDIENIQSRHALPLVVGGSGLYVRALSDHLSFPPTNPEVRARFQQLGESEGAQKLHELLTKLDPKAAASIDPNNWRRLVRALEVIELTGKPFTATLPDGSYWQPETRQFYLTRDPEVLDERINARTEAMFHGGLLEETQALLDDTAHPMGMTAAKATGYLEAIAVLRGEMTISEAIESTALSTRQLSRRQIKWFRRDKRLVALSPGETLAGEVAEIMRALR